MFEIFSERARRVVLAARIKAGERGRKSIDTADLLAGLIVEDQAMVETTLFPKIGLGGSSFARRPSPHTPFFSSTQAQELLDGLEKLLPQQSEPLATTAEIPLSLSVQHAFNSAKDLQTRLQHNAIEPLHLLAAALAEESSPSVELLRNAGITEAKVLLALRGDA
ncbi:MAG TPA: Clp protease N-terminal domain-containing protein [Candidatus Acidoferrales bacterium]